jgi:hypothetical protein
VSLPTPRAKLIAATALAALSLAACNRGGGSSICTPFADAAPAAPAAPGQIAPAPTGDPAAAVDDCLHRWGYTLAASTDTAEAVARATLAACTPALTRWNQQGIAAGAAPGSAIQAAPSLLTGQPTNPFAEHFAYAQSRALFYVVQARAGRCAPPPAKTANAASR